MTNPFIIQEDNPNIKDKQLSRWYDRFAIGEEDFWVRGQTRLRSFLKNYKINFFIVVVFAVFVVLSGRLFYLQLLQGQSFLALAEGNRVKRIPLRAPRGIIYDTKRKILVENFPVFQLELIPRDANQAEIDNALQEINSIVPLDLEEVKNKIESTPPYSDEPILLQDNISYDNFLDLKILLHNKGGFNLSQIEVRRYPFAEQTSHLLGYLGRLGPNEKDLIRSGRYLYNDFIGRAGLEKQYENILKGENGYQEIEVNALGQQINFINEVEPKPGKSIILNVDLSLQTVLQQSLQKQLDKSEAKKAAAVAIDPFSGKILALVSLPTFDNNIFTDPLKKNELGKIFLDENQPLFFRPVQGEYPSGSTFKPIVAAAALAEKIITPRTTFLSTGGLRISRWFFPDWKTGGHGITNVTKAIAESVNTFFYYIGGGYDDFRGLGVKRITAYAKKFGLTQITGIDYPGEADGFLPSPEWKQKVKEERWYVGDTYNLSIGQGDVLVTPLQMAVAYSAIVNGGIRYQPQLVKAFLNEDTQTVEKVKPQVKARVDIDEKFLATVKEGLREAVEYGSARRLSLLKVTSGGKTGTAQVGGDKKPHAWFVGFAPYDKPEILLVIIIENAGEGSTYAVPVAYDVFKWYFDDNKNTDKQ